VLFSRSAWKQFHGGVWNTEECVFECQALVPPQRFRLLLQCLPARFTDRMGRDCAAQADIPIGIHEFKFVVNDNWVTSNAVPFSEDHFLFTKETNTAVYSSTLSEPCCTLNDICLCDSLLLPDHQCVAAEIETSAAHMIKHKSTTHTHSNSYSAAHRAAEMAD
jgi:hypothetical protein